MATILQGIDIGKVQTWRNSKQANILPIAIPGLDSEAAETVDMLGVLEFIDISSEITGTFDYIQGILFALKGFADGNQNTSLNLASPYVITNTNAGSFATPEAVLVKVNNIDYSWDIPGMNRAVLQLQLIIGGST